MLATNLDLQLWELKIELKLMAVGHRSVSFRISFKRCHRQPSPAGGNVASVIAVDEIQLP